MDNDRNMNDRMRDADTMNPSERGEVDRDNRDAMSQEDLEDEDMDENEE